MDIRKEKTKRSIINSFLELRSKKSIEQITIKELCEKAMISKSTFYSHYLDIYDLSDQLEDEIISKAASNLSNPKSILENPKEFTKQLSIVYFSQENLMKILFSGSRSGLLVKKMEKHLKELIFTYYPQYRNNLKANVVISYGIYGGFYTFSESSKQNIEDTMNIIIEMSEKSINLLQDL